MKSRGYLIQEEASQVRWPVSASLLCLATGLCKLEALWPGLPVFV